MRASTRSDYGIHRKGIPLRGDLPVADVLVQGLAREVGRKSDARVDRIPRRDRANLLGVPP